MVYVLLGVAVVLFLGVVVAPMIFIEAIKKTAKEYANRDFANHLPEDLSEVGIKIYEKK